MNENCECYLCSNKINERFCITCGHGYNSCESIWEVHELHCGDLPTIGHPLCPKCCHEDWKPEVYHGFRVESVKSFKT